MDTPVALVSPAPDFPPAVDPNEALLNSAQVRALFGNVSEMWVYRRLTDAESGFPAPLVIANRRFWKLGDLREWRDAQRRSVTKLPVSEGARSPKNQKRRSRGRGTG
jgi:hypothetical protein